MQSHAIVGNRTVANAQTCGYDLMLLQRLYEKRQTDFIKLLSLVPKNLKEKNSFKNR